MAYESSTSTKIAHWARPSNVFYSMLIYIFILGLNFRYKSQGSALPIAMGYNDFLMDQTAQER